MTGRAVRLLLGLFLCSAGIVLTLRGHLGVSPWDVLHGGLAERTGVSFGVVVQGVGAVVLLASLALGVRPGAGTIANLILIGVFENLLLDTGWGTHLGDGPLLLRIAALIGGIALIGAGSALYIGAHLGAGPRDGLMVALHVRGGRSIGFARTVVEACALVAGIALGGPVGVGTAVYTVAIGPATQAAFKLLRQTPVRETTTEPI